MPRIIWESDKQKTLEWSVANSLLASACNGTKIKRSHKKKNIDYTDPNNTDAPKVKLKHSFIKIADKVLVIDGKQQYLGKGSFGKVKLAEDEEGNIYALKISYQRGDISSSEQDILKDLGIFKGGAIRQDNSKEVMALSYLGKPLHQIKFSSELEMLKTAFLLVDAVNKLHLGQLSCSKKRFIHIDIKPANIAVSENLDVISLIDFGLSQEAGDNWDGSVNTDEEKGTKAYMAPEICDEEKYSFLSDIYALGITLSPSKELKKLFPSLIPSSSKLLHVTNAMIKNRDLSRPSLELVKIAFLVEIHKDSDTDLQSSLEKYNCLTVNTGFAKNLFKILTESKQKSLFIRAYNYLQSRLYPEKLTADNLQMFSNNQSLQKAVHTFLEVNIDIKNHLQSLLDNPNLQKALVAAYDYLGSKPSLRFKKKTYEFIQKIILGEDKSLNSIRSEMQQWIRGYGLFSESSSAQKSSRISFVYQSGLFHQPSTPFFEMNKEGREQEKQEILKFPLN